MIAPGDPARSNGGRGLVATGTGELDLKTLPGKPTG